MSSSLNLVDVLSRRYDSTSFQYREAIEAILENRFIDSHDHFDYELIPDMVLSTIAIAISSNGALVASTHGDHTVKIFQHDTGKFIYSFQGHPRTPWTVKFHPTDSNLVASGCLGCEVRVWDIRCRICRAFIRLSYSIISLSFQPHGGAHIGIASGPQLLFWDWRRSSSPEEDDVMYRPRPGKSQGQNHNQIIYPHQSLEPALVHIRNIRAVIFHPCGTVALAAAPDPPRQTNSTPAPCRLYSIECPLVGQDESALAGASGLALDTMPTLIPQIHLYSDGGLDISADGRYIFTCAMVAAKPVLALPAAARRTPPLPLLSSLLLSSSSRRSKWRSGGSPCSSNSSDSCFTAESENDKDGEGEGEVMSERDGEHMQGIGAALGSLVLGDRTQAVNPGRLVSIPGTHGLGDVCTTALQLNPLPRDMVHAAPESGGLGSFFSKDRSPVLPAAARASVVNDGSHLLFLTDPSSSLYPAGWSIEERLCLFKISLQVESTAATPVDRPLSASLISRGSGGADPKTVTVTGSFPRCMPVAGKGKKGDEGEGEEDEEDSHEVDPYTIVGADTAADSGQRGGEGEVEVCVEESMHPKCSPRVRLVQSKPLPGSLMRAVTSMKLSPSGRFGLIGYGVRLDNDVLFHANKKVACEILDMTDMSTRCLMTDDVDEVNIAQFHPVPGSGVLYGTKRGKVRVFSTRKATAPRK